MMAALQQRKKEVCLSDGPDGLLLLTSPLGDDTLPVQTGTLHAIGLEAVERISAPFEITLDVVSTARGIAPGELLNQSVTLTVRRKDGMDRYFNGVVRQVVCFGDEQRHRWNYQLEVVPRLWFLTQSVDCRIFQRQTTVEILKQIFSEHNVAVQFRISCPGPTREYTTQYNEDNLSFCHRLMQEAGMFYFFEHSTSAHCMVVTDVNRTFSKMAESLHRIIYLGRNVDIIDHWQMNSATVFGSVRLQDYNPEQPLTPVNGQQSVTEAGPGAGQRHVYHWPAMTQESAVARDRAQFRAEAARAAAFLCHGHGYDPNFCPGFLFTLETDPISGARGFDYALQEVRHSAHDESWIAGVRATRYSCHFTAFLQSVPWRERLSLPRPNMPGVFSAIVLGEDGEEIHADQLGRIKVRPLFDHRHETVAAKAIWVRTLNPWAGDHWGWQHLPRVGTEVGISFMSGDCDNPVVVGGFYHKQSPPMFNIPSEQTLQGFRSRSTLRGGTQEYNELSFDDRRGQEMLLVHAQKDHAVEVEHNQKDTIGNDRTVRTKRNDQLFSEIGDISVTADTGAITITAARNIELVCGGSRITMTPASISITTGSGGFPTANIQLAAAGNISLSSLLAIEATADADISLLAGGAVEITAGGDINLLGCGAVTIETADPAGVVCLPFPS